MIREVREEDQKLFIRLVSEFYKSEAVLHDIPVENILNTFKEIRAGSPYVKAYIIEEQGEPAGYGQLSLTYSNEAGGMVVWVEELYILEEYRGLGLGTKFMDFVANEFADTAKRFRLEVSKTNSTVQELYLRKGYIPLEYLQMVRDI